MRCTALILVAITAGVGLSVSMAPAVLANDSSTAPKFNSRLAAYIHDRVSEFDQIPDGRKDDLKKIAAYVREQLDAGQKAKLVFICTHNSRRSHLSQIWASDAAAYYRLSGVECFSGGTEGTAFNPRAIAALERAGMKIDKSSDDKNPRYLVESVEGASPLVCFSKKYSDATNPKSAFCAVMTCAEADKSCPTIDGAALRIPLHFEDPKVADGTPQEAARYDERCAQICREMLYAFSQVRPTR
jgi:arsenate reductase